jgi:hypothetical protein
MSPRRIKCGRWQTMRSRNLAALTSGEDLVATRVVLQGCGGTGALADQQCKAWLQH